VWFRAQLLRTAASAPDVTMAQSETTFFRE
jgi:hypothetical protein